jgi:hypothetical protein
MRALAMITAVLSGACANKPEAPIVPLDAAGTTAVYNVTLVELRRLLTPKSSAVTGLNWSERMYLNPVVLLPAADSANPMTHDSAWMADVLGRGLVKGVCNKPPATPCPREAPIALTSFSPPWSRGGDTAWVHGGYTGEIPGEATYEGVFWIFTLAPDDEGVLKVVRKGPPNFLTFEAK